MNSRVRCTWCGHIYDLGHVTVVARYTDCSMWNCPGCKTLVDDRGDTGWKSRKDYVRVEDEPQFDIYGREWAMREQIRANAHARESRRNGGA